MALAVCGRIARSVIGREGLRSAAAAALFRPLVRSSSSQISSLQPSYVPNTSLSEPPWPEVKLPDTTEEAECHKELCKNVNTMIATGQYERLFAVVFLASRQWKVTNEDLILINSEMGAECGDKIHLEKVLLVGSDNFTLIGKPLLGKDLVKVEATVIEKTESYPKISMRFWRRHRHQRKKITIRPQTVLRINSIEIAPVLS
ncbi:39S ribosomal protein L21, mitochondrial [Xenopus tropicalis]|uniref:Large ribosomal subunit protein bL21m n=1 Tax=Xenopus tropicalis TaxID=8364 RepID=Q28DD3_XENTR|nr:large ribosomal subunit protein bL21m [Xenopus tropicalis]CAJ82254.1 novel protein [Xenopus tropicalis]|eukprot:NP_001016810.1 39S ribosomal protein L21, mitochondrial [Xenopus tropicalis]